VGVDCSQVSWLGLRVGGRLVLSVHSSYEPGELLLWPSSDGSSVYSAAAAL